MKKININDHVYVRLTDVGKNIFYHQFDHLNNSAGREVIKPHYPITNEDGFTEFALHELFRIYGQQLIMGNPQVFVWNDLYFEDRDMKDA